MYKRRESHPKEPCAICGRRVRGMKLHYRALHNRKCLECGRDRFDIDGNWHNWIDHALDCSKFIRDGLDRTASNA